MTQSSHQSNQHANQHASEDERRQDNGSAPSRRNARGGTLRDRSGRAPRVAAPASLPDAATDSTPEGLATDPGLECSADEWRTEEHAEEPEQHEEVSSPASGGPSHALGLLGLTRAVAESLGEGVYALDAEGRVTYMNPAAERLLGWREGELLGRDMHQTIHSLRPDGTALPEDECPLLAVLRSGQTVRANGDVFVRKDGRIFAVAYTSAPIVERGRIVGAVLAFSDVSAERRVAQRQAVQHAVSQVLAEAADIEGATGAILARIGEGLGWEVGNFWLVEGETLRCVRGWQADGTDGTAAAAFLAASAATRLARSEGLPGRAWAAAAPVWIDDVGTDANFPRAASARPVGLHVGLAFPVMGPRGVLGVIEYLHTGIAEPDVELAQAVGTLGNQIGQAFERIRYEEALRAGEARTQAIINTAPDAIISIDAGGTILEFNPAAEHLFGFARADLIGQRMVTSIIPPGLRERHLAGLARYLATGVAHILGHPVETEGMRADGTILPIELTITRMPGSGTPTFTAHIRDITQRKEEEAERALSLRIAALRADVSAILAASLPLERQLQQCAEALVRHLGIARAGIWLLDDEEGMLELAASAGPATGPTGAPERVPLGEQQIGRIALARTPSLMNGVSNDSQFDDPAWAMREGIVAFAGNPLLAGDHVFGVVAAFARSALDERVLDAFAGIADMLAQGVSRQRGEEERMRALRLERRARTQAEALSARLQAVQTITEPVLAHLSLDRFLPEMLLRVREVLQVHGVSLLLLDPDGKDLVVRASEGLEVQGGLGVRVPVGEGVAGRIAATRQPMLIDDLQAAPVYSEFLRHHARSLLGVPLMIDGRLLGVLHVSTLHRHHFTKNEQHLLQLVADRVASALERARLYDAEQQAHADALALQQRFALLAEVGSVLTASLNYEQTLADLAAALVPQLADWCYIDLLDEEGRIERLALATTDQEQVHLLDEVRARHPLTDSPVHPVNRVIASGEALLIAPAEVGGVHALLDDEASRAALRAIDVTSALVVPLRTREEVFGALTLQVTGGRRAFGLSDLTLAQEIARRAAIAIENARLYRKTERALHQVGEIADQLLMQATQLDTIIQAIPGPVFVCDAAGTITRVNPSGAAMLGEHPDQDIQPISGAEVASDMFYPDGTLMPPEETPLTQALRGETRTDFRFMMRRFDTGEEVQLLASFAPTRDTNQHITGAVVVGNDISEIDRLAQQKDEFMSIASHELKTPLTSLKILAQITQRRLDRSGAAEVEQVRDMGRSITRMERLVNDLLDVTRIHAGKLALRLETFDLAALARQIAQEQHAATERDILVEVPSEPVPMTGDPERLGQVFTNLLSNAAKYSPPGSPVRLCLERMTAGASEGVSARGGGYARIMLHDAGGGIPPEAIPHIFERFYRAPGVEVQSGSGVGLGLGLYISREIIERHYGTVTVESGPSEGTTFTITLPLDALAAPAVDA